MVRIEKRKYVRIFLYFLLKFHSFTVQTIKYVQNIRINRKICKIFPPSPFRRPRRDVKFVYDWKPFKNLKLRGELGNKINSKGCGLATKWNSYSICRHKLLMLQEMNLTNIMFLVKFKGRNQFIYGRNAL